MRVLEFAQVMAVPACGLLLADLGADVIKVEPPRGDSFRLHQPTGVRGEGRGYAVFNRGKRSLCLDLAHPQAREVIDALVTSADVVLVSMKRSDLTRYGLDYARLRALRPELVYLENTPYGPRGPFADDGGYDVVVQGMSGIGGITAADQGGAPRLVRPAYADMGTGFLSALGILVALRERDRSGEGQRVETSLLSTALTLAGNVLHRFENFDPARWEPFERELARLRERGAGFAEQQQLFSRTLQPGGAGNIYFRHYRTSDGFLSVGCLSPGLNARLRKLTGLEDPRQGEDFDAATPEGFDALQAFVRRAEDLFRTKTTQEWIELLREGGVPCGPFHFPTEVFADPQVRANDYLVEIEHPALGRYQTFASPVRLDSAPAQTPRRSPQLGEHTDRVLAEAGLSPERIGELRSAFAVGPRQERQHAPATEERDELASAPSSGTRGSSAGPVRRPKEN